MILKKGLIALSLCAVLNNVNAQITEDKAKSNATTLTKTKEIKADGWTKGGTLNLNITESGRNDYWVKGGEKQSIGVRGLIDFDIDHKAGKNTWLNSFRARYGVLSATSTGDKFVKNDDYLNITSIYGTKLKGAWSFAGMASLETQFEQFFLSPGYIKAGPGFLYQPNAKFSLLLSPAMMNITTKLAADHKSLALFGVPADKTSLFGIGAYAQAKGNFDLAKNVNYKFFATAFSDYLNKPQNVILDCTNLLTLQVNKYIGATLSLNLRYNDWEASQTQMQHGIGVGFSYKL